MGKVFAYARVSTPRQGEKGVSLQEQRSAIERYAEQRNLQIVRWFEERETAAKTGRGEFTKMLRLLRLKTAQGVIIHKIDRGARNLEDWADLGKLVDAGADIHFAIENLDLKTVAGRLSADIQAVVAAHYSRNLREETRKGFYGRLKQGYYPLRAPIGYIDQGSAKPKIPDPVRAPFVREAFETYSTGTTSLPNLVEELFRRGLRNRSGGRLSLNGLSTMLRNPFYTGVMRIERTMESFPGNHEPLITATLFARVQHALDGKRVDRVANRAYTYSRIARCATCGYSLIAERQKGHVYYRCHDRPFKHPSVCPPTCIREDILDRSVISVLAQIDLAEKELEAAQAVIQEHQQKSEDDRRHAKRAFQLQNEQIQDRLSKLADLVIEGTIERSLFEVKQKALLVEQTMIGARLKELEHDGEPITALLEKTVELAKSPSHLFKAASVEKKRDLLKLLLSNLTVSSKNVEITLAPAFQLIATREKITECSPNRGTCRTWEEIIQQLLRNLVELRKNA